MKERPIIFSAEMVQAILDEKKTQTRRVIKPQPEYVLFDEDGETVFTMPSIDTEDKVHKARCPYGERGDRLWVREAWRVVELDSGLDGVIYKSDGHFEPIQNTPEAADAWITAHNNGKHRSKWRPSIFMPRWASRITLEIIRVRLQRIQDITEDDAAAEGTERHAGLYILDFARLWDSINAKRGYSWVSNPWVWVVGFKVVP